MLIVILSILAWIVAIVCAALSIKQPIRGIYGLAILIPFEFTGSIEWQGITWRPAHALLLVLWMITIITWLARKQKPSIKTWARTYKWLLIAVGAWWVIAIISALTGPYAYRSIQVLGFTAVVWSVIPLLLTHISKTTLKPFITVLIWTSVGTALFGLFQFYADALGLSQTITGLADRYTSSVFGFPRIQSTFAEPLYYGSYLLLPIGLLSAHTLFRKPAILTNKWLDWAALGLLGTVQLLTLSRGAILATAVICSILVTTAIITQQHAWRSYIAMWLISTTMALFAGIGLVQGASGISTYVNQLVNASEGEAVSQRGLFRAYAIEFWQDAPLIGHGPGSFGLLVFERYPQWQPVFEPGYPIVNHLYAELLAEIGLIGCLLSAGIMAATLYSLFHATKQSWKPLVRNPLTLGGLCIVAGIAVQYITFSTLYILPLALTVGVILCIFRLQGEKQEE